MIIDAFPAFQSYWRQARQSPVEQQITGWADMLREDWPELLTRLQEDYRSQGLDWRTIAREKIFPSLDARVQDMALAHGNLLPLCEPVAMRARQALGMDIPIVFVIYVGIGCGAGWAAEFGGAPAVLIGLENIAEEGWTGSSALENLLVHEVSHLAYRCWREQAGVKPDESAWGQLVDEGFAQYCESSLLTEGRFHENEGEDDDWLEWCSSHLGWLANEFTRAVDAGEPVSKFFGSWFNIEGRSQTGYFLGHQVILNLVDQGLSLRQIALLDPQQAGRAALQEILSS
jgi:hypothetical protein